MVRFYDIVQKKYSDEELIENALNLSIKIYNYAQSLSS